jgi:cytochrome c553
MSIGLSLLGHGSVAWQAAQAASNIPARVIETGEDAMRSVAIVAVLAIAATAGLAPPARAQAPDGEAAYREACASCHRTPVRFMRRYLDMTPAQRQAELDRFLAGHYAPDAAQRGAIIAWLEANHTGR